MPHTYSFELSSLWKRTLGPQRGKDPHEDQRTRLRECFMRFREQAGVLAGEIARDLPSRTVHDITHLDALWGIADTIVGDEYEINPAEAFVLGGSFLVHDLAMSRASYPRGLDSLRQEPAWRDTVAMLLKSRLGRAVRVDEIDSASEDIVARATEDVIVERHAQQAAELPTTGWISVDKDDRHYLIEDQQVRDIYGPTIGKIAQSHWWSVDDLPLNFAQPLGAAGWCPSWDVNKLKIACILRAADAAHLDDRRAPSFLRVLRRPSRGSDEYWQFQELLLPPSCAEGWVRYSAKRPFKVSESAAWWICFDSLQMVDRELRQVDALLSDTSRGCGRFQARAVMKIDRPERLAEMVQTDGWIPVDAKIRVSDVASLATSIGGRQLYGDDSTIPVRELVQNGIDALRARRLLDDRPKDWGFVRVSLGKDDSGDWLEVEDTGIGMSRDVLTGPLVDFGASYWNSHLMRREHPGLLGKGFQSVGRYGIGFFSTFMVGDKVKVTTQRYEQGKQDALVLEFGTGLPQRPVLRPAQREEWLREGGTRVRVWLKQSPVREGGLLHARNDNERSLESLCIHMFPALAVNLRIKDGEAEEKQIVSADDWVSIEPVELRHRIDRYSEHRYREKESGDPINSNMKLLKDSSGQVVGRACIDPYAGSKRGGESGVITVGGILADRFRMIVGVMVGTSVRATRDTAVPVVSPEELSRWATEQARLVVQAKMREEERAEIADFICACGGDPGDLPIGWSSNGPMTIGQVKDWANSLLEVILTADYEVRSKARSGKGLHLLANVLVINNGIYGNHLIDDRLSGARWPKSAIMGSFKGSQIRENTIKALVLKTLAESWGVAVGNILAASGDKDSGKHLVGRVEDKELMADIESIKKPTV